MDDIIKNLKEFQIEVKQDIEQGMQNLAAITYAKVAEMANSELHSTRKTFLESLSFAEITPGVWVVALDEKAFFIEEGLESNKDMKPDLLKNSTKVSKEGYRYRTIPFDYGKGPSQMTPYAQNLVNLIKYKLKKQGVPFKKIERDSNGNPRIGKLHTFNFGGGNPSSRASATALQGLSIYQSLTKSGSVRRDIMTMRTVSENPSSADKWIHPGIVAKKLLDKSLEWAEREWESTILPEILRKWE